MRTQDEQVDLEKFKIDHNKPMLAGEAVVVTAYANGAVIIDNDSSPECLCKQVVDGGTKTTNYLVKYVMTGSNAGNMVDPNDDENLGKRGDWTSNGRFEFRRVTKTAFDLYLKFLLTDNKAHFRQAAREVLN